MTTATFKIVLRKDHIRKNGQYLLCLRAIIARKSKLFPILNFTCFDKDFDEVNGIVRKTDPAHYQKNLLIQKYLNKANKINFDYAIEEKTLSIDEFTKAFLNDNYGSKSFYEYIEHLIEKREDELAAETIQFYKKQLSKLRRFRPNLLFSEVNGDFIQSYKKYMIQKLGNQEITWYKSLEFIKRICNRAYKEKKINEHPLRDLEIKRLKGSTNHLTIDEIHILEEMYRNNEIKPNLRNVLRYFLFACYTGMRFRDVHDLRALNIVTVEGIQVVEYAMHKTKKPTLTPLIEQAVKLIPDNLLKYQKVFKVTTNQDTNRKLKTIIQLAGIEKAIIFHSSRHTCSNILLSLNIPTETRAMIIGDTEEVLKAHYTEKNITILAEAMRKYSESLKNK